MRTESTILRLRLNKLALQLEVHKEKEAALLASREALQKQQTKLGAAQQLIITIGQLYRKRSVENVQSTVTKALQLVYEHPYEFLLRQGEKRGQIEDEMLVLDEGSEMDPVTEMGGGIVDVISIVLRPILWSKMTGRSSPVMVMDEPARLVNSDRSVRNLAQLFWQLAKGLSLQFLVVTNKPGLVHGADRLFEVVKHGKVSEVHGGAG